MTTSQGFCQNNIHQVGQCGTLLLMGVLFGYCLLRAHFSGNVAMGLGEHFEHLELSLPDLMIYM